MQVYLRSSGGAWSDTSLWRVAEWDPAVPVLLGVTNVRAADHAPGAADTVLFSNQIGGLVTPGPITGGGEAAAVHTLIDGPGIVLRGDGDPATVDYTFGALDLDGRQMEVQDALLASQSTAIDGGSTLVVSGAEVATDTFGREWSAFLGHLALEPSQRPVPQLVLGDHNVVAFDTTNQNGGLAGVSGTGRILPAEPLHQPPPTQTPQPMPEPVQDPTPSPDPTPAPEPQATPTPAPAPAPAPVSHANPPAGATVYSGPVDYLQWQFLGSSGAEVRLGSSDNDFINLLGGDDAAAGLAGRDVIDGGTGSNFLAGGEDQDTFFLDGRGGSVTWSTITDWKAGEQLSVWGWKPGASQALWVEDAGTLGFRGVTMHGDLNGDGTIDTSVTWAGHSRADLPAAQEMDGLLWFA